MTDPLDIALATISAAGLGLIHGSFIDFETAAKIEIEGDADAFAHAAKALGATVVFVETHAVSSEEFMLSVDDDDDASGGEEIDLREAYPWLAAQNARVGERRAVDFACVASGVIITKLIRAEWDDEFIDAISTARDSWYEAAAQS